MPQRFSYQLEIVAEALNEARLRDLLQQRFGISDIVIRRSPVAAIAGSPSHIQKLKPGATALLRLLADGKPHRRKALIAKLKAEGMTIQPSLFGALEDRRLIRKVQHGVYAAADAPPVNDDDVPPPDWSVPRATEEKALELLRSPCTPYELRIQLGVTRQRVEQLLQRLESRGLVKRREVVGDRSRHVYALADVLSAAAIVNRQPVLTDGKAALLSILAPDQVHSLGGLAEALGRNIAGLSRQTRDLEALGLLSSIKLGNHTYIAITPRGLRHGQYQSVSEKAQAADLIDGFGPIRCGVLQTLQVAGRLRTRELTYSLPRNIFEGQSQSTGQIIQRLRQEGLIEPAEVKPGENIAYQLTPIGGVAARFIGATIPPPTPELIKERIGARRREYADCMRQKHHGHALKPSEPQGAILAALSTEEPLTAAEITDRMKVRFKNDKSIHLALRLMHQRGWVERAECRVGGARRVRWKLLSARAADST